MENPSRLRCDTITDGHAVVYNGPMPVATLTAEERNLYTQEVRTSLRFVGRSGFVQVTPMTLSGWPPTEEELVKLRVTVQLHGGQL